MAKTADSKSKKHGLGSFTAYLVKRFTDQDDPWSPVSDPEMRSKYAFLEAGVSIVGNLVLAIIKVIFGLAMNSISLLADAVHTASDVLTSIVVILGFKIAQMPADEKHPFGHGRVEFLSTLVIAGLLTYVGVEFGKSSYSRLMTEVPVKGSIAVAIVMVVGALVKEWMTRFALHLGKMANAQALIGDAWHHRTDAIASLLVAVAIVASMHGYHWVDAVLGLAVSALIIYTGIELAISSASSLIGERAPKELENQIRDVVANCSEVRDFHEVMIHDYGGRKSVSLHILVDSGLSLVESHDIATEIEHALKIRIPGDIVVHVEPEPMEEKQGMKHEY